MNKYFYILLICFAVNLTAGQEINTDSLLTKALTNYKGSFYKKATKQALLGKKISPTYLDFHLLLGQIYHKTQNIDSARYYYQYVIRENPVYKAAFSGLIRLEIGQNNLDQALQVADISIKKYPQEIDFYNNKLKIIRLQKDEEKLTLYLQELILLFPSEDSFKEQLKNIKATYNSDRIAMGYNYTFFSRDNAGPWHLLGLQYIRERKELTLIARLNYIDRRASGTSIRSGLQYEIESYIKTGKKSTSFINIAYSNDPVFPKLKLGYSNFMSFNHGWEADLGVRYINTDIKNLYTVVLGTGKYLGNYWLNLRSYLSVDSNYVFPAFNVTSRYYFNSKYNYISMQLGYGNSPDDRVNINRLNQFKALTSYRAALGASKMLGSNYLIGIQFTYNRQEYILDKFQNEFDSFLLLQYKF